MDFGDAFPGRARFATERIAEKYSALFKEHADFVVDLHTGGDHFVQHPFVIFTVTGTVPRERMESLARLFGVPTLWRDRDKVFASDITITVPAMGVPAFLLEVGGGGVMERQQDERQAAFALSFLRGVVVRETRCGRSASPSSRSIESSRLRAAASSSGSRNLRRRDGVVGRGARNPRSGVRVS
jgi:predicted deacylase